MAAAGYSTRKGRAYVAGIGSPEWQKRTGHTVNARGVPIPTRAKAKPAAAHAIRYKVTASRLTCATCGKGIEGARTGFTGAWQGGRHAVK